MCNTMKGVIVLFVLALVCSQAVAMRLPNTVFDVGRDERMLTNIDADLNFGVRYISRSLKGFISHKSCKEGEKMLPPPVSRCVSEQDYKEYMDDDEFFDED